MNKYKYIGLFINNQKHEYYRLEVNAFNFTEAFFLLTSKAIELGSHPQLYSVTNDNQDRVYINKLENMNICVKQD